ncbi:uncharacterized protein LOC108858752 [Raphanus sativus]|uniref:Uncharacterized protein LOC108858752 n=1 Tax=Raphanus sativus TaxID=3726 RepID=A0A6J0NVH3_RAPSA|nr:uncharacterized protein LOC108858752 [Raphanus sativus]
MQMFLWSALQDALPTGDNLKRRKIKLDAQCPRCGQQETTLHIFFTCSFAMKVWKQTPLYPAVHTAALQSFKEGVIIFRKLNCLPPSGISINILPWICWAIWTSRNQLLFEDRGLAPEEVAIKGLNLAREWTSIQSNRKAITPPIQRSTFKQQITTPHPETVYCKTDASWDATSNFAGLAWIFSGPHPSMPMQGSIYRGFVSSPLMAEALAVRSSIQLAATLQIPHLRVCSDSQTLIKAIINRAMVKEIIGVVADIFNLSSLFSSISFIFIPRGENCDADALAKLTLRLRSSVTNPFMG